MSWPNALSDGSGAVAGLKVVDLSRVLGGPSCTQILGDHGADVIKIEPPQGDETRTWGPPFLEGSSAYFEGVNRNKRGVTLDLKQPAARDALLVFLSAADVLVENFKPGTLESWGLTVEGLAERFPRLVHCRISGFGADGPLGGLPGYDAAVQATVGLMSVNGERDRGPTRLGVPVVDLVSGLDAVVGILLALHERARSGRGQFVDIALFDAGISLLHPQAANFFASGDSPERTGNAHPNISPYDSFATAQGDLFLAVGNNGQFRKLCVELGAPALADDLRYVSNGERVANREELKRDLEALLVHHRAAAVAEVLLQAGVPCGAVLSAPEALAHPHTSHRGLVWRDGDYTGLGAPVKLSRTPASFRRPPPRFGEHQREVLDVLS